MFYRILAFRREWAQRRAAHSISDEAGFTIVEAVASLLVLSLVLSAGVATTIAGYRAVRETKFFQQATALGNEAIESARDLAYDDLVMVDSDLAGDARVLSACSGFSSGRFFDPDGAQPDLTCEPLVSTTTGGAISDHIAEQNVAGKSYTVSRYVTWVDEDDQGGPDQSYKRLLVIVEWDSSGTARSFQTSTFISRARRGLPAPKFELSPATQTKDVEAGQTVVFAHSIKNLGITDAYDLTMSVPAGWGLTFYEDLGEPGVFVAGEDAVLSDTNGSSTVDTGDLAPNETFYFIAVVTVPLSQAIGDHNMTMTAASGVDSTVTKTATDTARVRLLNLSLYVHNNPTPPVADTAAVQFLDMNNVAPTATTLFRYSTNYYSGAAMGRYLQGGAVAATSSDTRRMASWVYQVPSTTRFQGSGEVRIWVAAQDLLCDKTIPIQVYLREKSSRTAIGSTSEITSATATVAAPGGIPPCGFRQVTIPLTNINRNVIANRFVELKIQVGGTSSDAGMFAYDTVDFASRLVLPLGAT